MDALQGVFTDPPHHEPGTWKGARFITDVDDVITLIGSDDGTDWFCVTGAYTSKDEGKIAIDFSPKGGPKDIAATWADGKLTFADGNFWQCIDAPGSVLIPEAGASVLGGVFTDPPHHEPGTWQGVRMITNVGDVLTLIGTDDGSSWFCVTGTYAQESGEVVIDFSPKGGPKDIAATWADGKLTFADGNFWSKVLMLDQAKASLRAAFNQFDVDGSGTLSPEELTAILTRGNASLSAEDSDALLASFDADGDGRLRVDEFVDLMLQR